MYRNQLVVISDLDANFLLTFPLVLFDQLVPVLIRVSHSFASTIGAKCTMTALCSHLALRHLNTVINNKYHFDVLVTRVSLRVILDFDGSIPHVLDS